MGNLFTKLTLLSNKFPFIINTLFPPLREILCAGSLELLDEVLQANVLYNYSRSMIKE